jgi:tRNA pseudouridine38-40 synthase
VEHGVRLTVAYDGAGFAGFAAQPDQRTVQGVLATAAERVCGHAVTLRGASRTDAGVHALGQVVAFASARELAPERWRAALNRYLPEDVVVRAVAPCAPDYNPRFDARHKTYRYLFHLGQVRDPLLRGRAWHAERLLRRVPRDGAGLPKLDLTAMREGCARLTGTHDFRAFRAAADPRENSVRTLLRMQLFPGFENNPALLAFEVQGESFMLNMVRILAGSLLELGRGRMSPEAVAALLDAKAERRDNPAFTAPAHGLTLIEVCLGKNDP